MNSGSQHSPQKYFPAFETTPVCETSAEYLEDRLEILDLTERIEALLMLLTEVGPELDAFVRATLADELHTLLYHLGIDMNSQDAFDDYKRKRDEMRERVEQVIDRDEVDTVLRKLGVPEQDHVSLRAAIEKVLILRTLGSVRHQYFSCTRSHLSP